MENSIDEKLKALKSDITLNKLFSEQDQVTLAKKSLSEQNEAIVKSIFQVAHTKGISLEALKKNTNNYELSVDKKSGEAKTKRLSLIESMAKKVSKELEKKYKDNSKNSEQDAPHHLTLTFSKGFINELLKEPDKMARVNTIQTALEPQLLTQMPAEMLHKPWKEVFKNAKNINLIGTGLNIKPGNGTVLETISQTLAEIFEYSRLKSHERLKPKNVNLSEQYTHNEKPNQPKKDDKPKDMINISTDHINDMVLPGEQVDFDKKDGQNNMDAQHSDSGSNGLNDKKMTADEEMAMMQEMGLVPPWLRK